MPLLPAAIGIILNNSRTEVLLVKRGDVPVWVLPGGGVEVGEKPDEALIREIQEETGVNVQIERKCAELTPLNRLASFTSVYICRVLSGDIRLSDETSSVAFFPLQQLPPSFFPPHAFWLQEGLSSAAFIQRPLTEISYFNLLKFMMRHPWQVLRFGWTRFVKNCAINQKN